MGLLMHTCASAQLFPHCLPSSQVDGTSTFAQQSQQPRALRCTAPWCRGVQPCQPRVYGSTLEPGCMDAKPTFSNRQRALREEPTNLNLVNLKSQQAVLTLEGRPTSSNKRKRKHRKEKENYVGSENTCYIS
eukprot:scaffold86468_cov21-Tisochrysis_lutea.AAC.1